MRALLTVFLVSVMATAAGAHDLWLEPDSSFPAGETTLKVRLFVGMNLKHEKEYPYEAAKIESFFARGSAQAGETKTAEGQSPAFEVPLGKAGDLLFGAARAKAHIELTAEEFNSYLAEDGMKQVLDRRKQTGAAEKPARENYVRYLKTFARVGNGDGKLFTEPVGYRIEIVPKVDPLSLKSGAELPLTVLFDGKPLAGATVFAELRGSEPAGAAAEAVTAEDGSTSVRIAAPGFWIVKVIHMRECGGCADADYESFWANITFEVKNQ